MVKVISFILLFIGTFFLKAQDQLVAATGTATDDRSGKSGSFRLLTRARLDVTGVDKVLLVASFDTQYDRGTDPRNGHYKLTDGTNESPVLIQSITEPGGIDKGIATLIDIFDASSTTGSLTYRLMHASSTNQNVRSSGTLVAISLTTSESGREIPHDIKSTSGPVATSGTWSVVDGLRTSGITLAKEGDLYVAASVNSLASSSATGEWQLQYAPEGTDNWNNCGSSSTLSIANADAYEATSLSYIIQDLAAGTYSVRLLHRQTQGDAGRLETHSATLAACALVYTAVPGTVREFPSFSIQSSGATTTTSSSMSPLLSHTYNPGSETDLFIQAQYGFSTNAPLDAAGYDLVIDQGILDGTTQLNYISSDAQTGSGGSVGLGSSLEAGTGYGISLRHQSRSGIELTTQNASLAGFQLTSVGTSVWTGEAVKSTDWEQNDNWIGDVPGSSGNAHIPAGLLNYPILEAPTACMDLYLDQGGSLTLEPQSNLTIYGNAEISGSLEVLSDAGGSASLIVLGEATGVITFNNHLTADRWYIVSPPVGGQVIQDFLDREANQIPFSTNYNAYGLTDYSELNNKWNSFFPVGTPGNFNPGEGYLMRRENTDGSVTYNGEIQDSDLEYEIYNAGTGWNAVGNPFTSSIGVTFDAATAENFLTHNLDKLDPNYSVLYLWDESDGYTGTLNNYKVIGNAGYIDLNGYEELQMDYLQAGQGFLVKSVSGGGTLQFTQAMQAHQNSTGMVKSAGTSWDGFKLVATSGDRSESAIICFHEEMSPGLDPSFDAGLLNSKPEFGIYTNLLEEDEGIGFKVQCLPYPDSAGLEIPVGVDLLSGGAVSFSADGIYFQDSIQIILEDRFTKTYTELATHGNTYEVLLGEGRQDSGRFYLHVRAPIITTGLDSKQEEASFWATCLHASIRIHGRINEEGSAYLFDMAGRKLGSYTLQKGELHEIHLPSLEEGIYLLAITEGPNRAVLKILKNE